MPGDPKTIRRQSVICRKGEAGLWQLNRRPGEVDGLALTKDVALHVQEAMQGHLKPLRHEKRRRGSCYRTEGRFSLVGKGVRNWKEFSGYAVAASASSRRERWKRKEGSYGLELFHREERPALKRNIIDTSERDPRFQRSVAWLVVLFPCGADTLQLPLLRGLSS
jgi:hypothetical protein